MTERGAERTTIAEASVWLAQLHGPERSAELESDFRAWLAVAPEHAHAFERVTDVWDSVDAINVGGLPRLDGSQATESRRPRVNLTVLTLVLGAIVFGASWMLRDPVYSTAMGEQRVLTLQDGSRVSLNSSTRIKVDFDARRRSIELEQGEALFDVVGSAHRPFVVRAGERSVTALGTRFLVRREPDRFAVTLLQGRVAVSEPEPRAAAARVEDAVTILEPGQRLTLEAHRVARIDAPPMEHAVAWQRGEVILDETPLSEAVAEMNRYDLTQLEVAPEIARLPVSGIYRTGNNQDFATAVATLYPLHAEPHQGRIVLTPAP